MIFITIKIQSADILKELECHDRIVLQGVKVLGFPREVESLFGLSNVDHFISNFGSRTEAAVWHSVAYFSDRYVLSLWVPVAIDFDKCMLVGASNAATIQINQVVKVEVSRSGIAGATMKGQWTLNENEWRFLVKSGGKWPAVGVPIVTNAPVEGFSEYARQSREPIRNRKEGFDNVIKQTIESIRKRSKNLDKKNPQGK